MKKENKFNKAIILSIILHCCILPVFCWLSASLLSAAPVEEILELEMVNDSSPAVLNQIIQLPAAPQTQVAALPAAAQSQLTPMMSAPAEQTVPQAQPAISQPAQSVITPVTPGSISGEGNPAPSGGSSQTVSSSGSGSGEESAAPASSGPPKTGIVTPPRVLARTDPSYPQDARSQGAEGSVRVRIEVGEDGQPGSCSVVGSSGNSSLDNAALQAVKEWSFVPAKDQDSGNAIRCYTNVSVVFHLN